MKKLLTLMAASLAASWLLPAQAAAQQDLPLYTGQPLPSWHVTVAGFESPDQVLQGSELTLPKPAGSYAPDGYVRARAGEEAGRAGALTLGWRDAWRAALSLDGGAPLDLRPYLAGGTLEFDLNVADLAGGGLYVTMRCGPECSRKVPYVLPGRALQGKGWQHVSFALRCFARDGDDFSHVPAPFILEGNGAGAVSVANVRLVRHGQPNAQCPDERTVAVTPAMLTHAWALGHWQARHRQKLEELRQLKAAGKQPQVVFIGDSITEGWEKAGQPVWQQYYAPYDALALGFGGDHTENVLWRLQHGEVDGIAPKVAVLMIGTNNAGDREEAPERTAAGVKAVLDELHRRLPHTKVLLLAVFPRDEQPSGLLRRINARTSSLIARYADGNKVVFADINAAFLDANGTLSREIMPDLLHPGEKGYAIWARSMAPTLQKMLSE